EPELCDVARDGRLHGVDPLLAERRRHLDLRRERPLLHQAQDRSLSLELRRHAATSEIASSESPRHTSRSTSANSSSLDGVRPPACSAPTSTTTACGSASSRCAFDTTSGAVSGRSGQTAPPVARGTERTTTRSSPPEVTKPAATVIIICLLCTISNSMHNLVLEDDSVFPGVSVGAPGVASARAA